MAARGIEGREVAEIKKQPRLQGAAMLLDAYYWIPVVRCLSSDACCQMLSPDDILP